MRVVDVSAGSGAVWVKQAWQLFKAQPLQWISLISTWVIVSFFMALVPLVGAPAMTMAQPGFFAGFIIACRDQEMGKAVNITHLLAGFKVSGRTLIQIGAISLLLELLVMMALSAFGFFDGLKGLDRENLTVEAISLAFEGQGPLWFAALVAIVLIKGVLWFTAALIAHQPMPASHAIRWSFYALIGNFLPLLVFGVIVLLLLLLATIPWMLGLIVFLPVYAICHYTSFKAVFRADADVQKAESTVS